MPKGRVSMYEYGTWLSKQAPECSVAKSATALCSQRYDVIFRAPLTRDDRPRVNSDTFTYAEWRHRKHECLENLVELGWNIRKRKAETGEECEGCACASTLQRSEPISNTPRILMIPMLRQSEFEHGLWRVMNETRVNNGQNAERAMDGRHLWPGATWEGVYSDGQLDAAASVLA